MTKTKSTKRALLMSALALLMCVSMLIGSTYAWFTDSVTSANNKIVAGNLDVGLYLWTAAGEKVEITDESAPIFGAGSIAQNKNAETLWEPGKTQVAYLSIKNNGTLDLKYKVAINVEDVAKDLYKAMEYAIVPDATFGEVTSWTGGKTVTTGINATDANDVALKKGEEHFFALSIHMQEEAGNEYMNGQVNFDIKVLAGQLTSEEDSFGPDYDKLASYPGTGFATVTDGVSAVEIPIRNEQETKVGSVVIPAEAIAAGVTKMEANIADSSYDPNITIAAGLEMTTYDVSVVGLKENNDVPVKVQLRIKAGLDPATVALYHYDGEVPGIVYNPETGYVTFETLGFSPFSVVYDAESVYVAPPVEPEKPNHPTANVTQMTVAEAEAELGVIDWGSYGQWSPNPDLEAELDCLYKFECADTAQEAADGPFATWECDFYLKLDRDLGENEIFLGGNYGDFGWVGFHKGDVTLAAGEEIPLLGSVVTNGWTYADVANFVGTFYCGAGDVSDALEGATLTVMLRVTDPETGNSYNVNTINHVF